MKRRTFLASAGATAAASSLPAPAIAQGVREFKLVSSFPRAIMSRLEQLARRITDLSGGRLRLKTFAAGELVDAFEVFDAVSEGKDSTIFALLEQEIAELAREPTGVGFDLPPWLVALEDEVASVRSDQRHGGNREEIHLRIATVHLSFSELQEQLDDISASE